MFKFGEKRKKKSLSSICAFSVHIFLPIENYQQKQKNQGRKKQIAQDMAQASEKEKNKIEAKTEAKVEAKKSSAQNQQYGKILLARHLKDCQKNADGFSVGLVDDDNLYEWNVVLEGPEGTMYEGGYFQATLSFPEEFPNKPPKMKFTTPGFWHPNVYNDGTVCISILHEAKEDEFNPEEKMDEKWRPILSVEAIL
ncbi:hypothetical protein RFI_01766, partial [Reticulomyxa filosa]